MAHKGEYRGCDRLKSWPYTVPNFQGEVKENFPISDIDLCNFHLFYRKLRGFRGNCPR